MDKQGNRQISRLIVGVILVFAIWLFYAFIVMPSPLNLQDLGTHGDAFGPLSSLFSGLAFVGLIITIFLQMEEIARLAAEQKRSAALLDQQVHTLKLTAKLNYLNEVISYQRKLLTDNNDNDSWSSVMWRQTASEELKNLKAQREQLVLELSSHSKANE